MFQNMEKTIKDLRHEVINVRDELTKQVKEHEDRLARLEKDQDHRIGKLEKEIKELSETGVSVAAKANMITAMKKLAQLGRDISWRRLR